MASSDDKVHIACELPAIVKSPMFACVRKINKNEVTIVAFEDFKAIPTNRAIKLMLTIDVISAPIELFTSMAFLIYTSVMLASFIVSAYKNKTMNLMFSYPIKRQKILASQMIAVWTFNFAALILTIQLTKRQKPKK